MQQQTTQEHHQSRVPGTERLAVENELVQFGLVVEGSDECVSVRTALKTPVAGLWRYQRQFIARCGCRDGLRIKALSSHISPFGSRLTL